MNGLARAGLGVLLCGGVTLLAFLLLSPSVWERADFEGYPFAVGFAATTGWIDRTGARPEPFWKWLRFVVPFAVGFAAVMLTIFVLFGAVFGEGTLRSTDQRIAFSCAAVIAVACFVWLHRLGSRPKGSSSYPNAEDQERRAQVRANIRREIEEIEHGASDNSVPPVD